jgi:hypothetical protein
MCKTDFFYGDYRKESIGVLKIAFCLILFANVRKTILYLHKNCELWVKKSYFLIKSII